MSRTADPELPPLAEPPPVNGHADYDALADLFLGEDRPAPTAAPAVARPAPRAAGDKPVEGLVLGHLPVMASAWVQQYARHVCGQRGGPVGLLRLRAGEAQLDVVGGSVDAPRPCASLEEAIHAAAGEVVAWVLRVDETTEPDLPELKSLSTVTLLTGADEAAVVAAYTTLKKLVRPCDEAAGPELAVTIMGATPEKAAEATAKLERATAVFMGKPVRIASCIARIGGRASAVLFRGPWAGKAADLIRVAAASRAVGPRPIATEPSVTPSVPQAAPSPAKAPDEPVVSRLGRLHPGSSTPVACGPLAAHIAGLKDLELSCPYAAGVEFAIDHRGVMHVLGRLETTDLTGLLTAAAWVRSHHALLRMALSPRIAGFEAGEASVLHLFSEDARRVRALGDTPVRLHLLARVEGGGWFSSPLN